MYQKLENSENQEAVPTEGAEGGGNIQKTAQSQIQPELGLGGEKQNDCGDEVQRFLMIDHGEDIIKQLNDVSSEYKRQVHVLSAEMDMLWQVLRTFMMLFGPLLIGIVILIMAKCTLPRGFYQNMITSIFVGIFTALIAIRYRPFQSAVEKYSTFRKSKKGGRTAAAGAVEKEMMVGSDSDVSTVQESLEESEESKLITASTHIVGKTKSESEYFDMLPDPSSF